MWLPFFWILVAGIAALLAYALSEYLVMILASVVVGLIGLWVLGCVFSPAVPDRKCPRCGEDGLVKLKRGEPLGVRCERCGFRDERRHVAYLDEW